MDLQLEEKQLESEYGHSGHRENEICDELAKQGAENPTFEDIGYEG